MKPNGRWHVIRGHSVAYWYAVSPSWGFRPFPSWRAAFDYADRMARADR